MHYLSPAKEPTQAAPEPPLSSSMFASAEYLEYLEKIAMLTDELKTLRSQMETLEQQRNDRDRPAPHYYYRQPRYSPAPSNHYSPVINLAFSVLKWLFLFLIGFAVACIASASLNAPEMVQLLLTLLKLCLVPLIALTFCVIAAAVICESIR